MMKTIISKADALIRSRIVLWTMVIIGSCVYGLLCFGKTIWLDEALTGSFIRMGWWELICFTATDVHPPLYYLIVKLGITLFGDKIYIVKLFSYLPFVFTLLLTAVKVRKAYGEKTAFVLMALLCTTPCIIDRNVEMRMYQWALFFVFAFALYLFDAVKNSSGRARILCLFWGLCAAYTHYYALIAVAILYAILFFVYIKEKDVVYAIIKNAVASVIGYLPWLVVFLNQAKSLKETGWWQEASLGLKDVYEYIVWPFQDNTGYEPIMFFLLLIFVLLFAAGKKTEYKMEILSSIGTYIFLIAGGLLIILFYQPVFVMRFIYPVVGVLLFGLALVAAQWRTEVICIFCAFILLFGAKTYNSQLHYQFNKASIPALITFMETVEEEDAVILCDQDAVKCIVEYLYPQHFVENSNEADQSTVEGKDVYYLVCDPASVEENGLGYLGLNKYELIDNVYVQYHSFDIYSAQSER